MEKENLQSFVKDNINHLTAISICIALIVFINPLDDYRIRVALQTCFFILLAVFWMSFIANTKAELIRQNILVSTAITAFTIALVVFSIHIVKSLLYASDGDFSIIAPTTIWIVATLAHGIQFSLRIKTIGWHNLKKCHLWLSIYVAVALLTGLAIFFYLLLVELSQGGGS